ncbi:MAG: hypothetical protein HC933_00280 [Pleurocapsa sp. SU_196_0]|nr:hypothetical protein [Pleurocapsa sp. SU_196_0]
MNPTWQPVTEPDVLEALQTNGVTLEDAELMRRELSVKLEHRLEMDLDATVGRMVNGKLVTLHCDSNGYEVGVMAFPGTRAQEASSLNDDGVQTTMLELQAALQGLRDTCQEHWVQPPTAVRHWMAGLDSSGEFLSLESWLQFGELLEMHPDAPEVVVQAWLGATSVALVEGTWVSRADSSSHA